tara:strand:- start:322 stop:528 length:207 start_codon:yes stop_codon:yes gene_type:complete
MKNNINEKLENKSAKKAELEKQWFARQITTKEFQDSMNALDGIQVVNGVIMNVDLNANLNGNLNEKIS